MGLSLLFVTRFDEALIKLKKALELDSSCSVLHLDIGNLYDKTKEFEKAEEYYTRYISLVQNSWRGHYFRGCLFERLERWKESFSDYSMCIQLQEKVMDDIVSEIYLRRALVCIRIGELNNCVDDCTVLLESKFSLDDPARIYYYRGTSYHIIGDYEKAFSDFSKCIEIEPKFPAAYEFRGDIYVVIKNIPKLGYQDYTTCLRMDPFQSDVLVKRGRAHVIMNERNGALKDFTEAINIDRKNKDAYIQRADLHDSLIRRDLAIKDIREYLSIDPTEAPLWMHLGKLYLYEEDYENCLACFEQATKIDPEEEKELKNEGFLAFLAENYEKTKETFPNAGTIPSDRAAYLEFRGNLYSLGGRYKEAKKDFLESLKLRKCVSVMIAIAEMYMSKSKFNRAEEWFKKAVQEFPESPEAYKRRSELMVFLDPERAVDDIRRSMLAEKLISPDVTEFESALNSPTSEYYEELAHSPGNMTKYEKVDWHPFSKDEVRDEEMEKSEILILSKSVQSKGFGDLVIYHFLGGGVYGSTYLCRIKNVEGLFVVKIFIPHFSDSPRSLERQEDMIKREYLRIPYHRNVVSILSASLDETIDVTSLPDSEQWIKNCNSKVRRSGIVLMKFYREDLSRYLVKRKRDSVEFSNLELSYIADGLLKGCHHLHKNMIVHRDLHLSNVFIDPLYGRVYIGDFGCSLDLTNNPTKFRVRKDHELLFGVSGSYCYFKKGGYEIFLAPEVVDFDEIVSVPTGGFVDYEKNDVFSIGTILYILVSCFERSGVDAYSAFGVKLDDTNDEVPVIVGRKQEKYVRLHSCHDGELYNLIEKLMMVDPCKRYNYNEALIVVRKEIEILENKSEEKEELSSKFESVQKKKREVLESDTTAFPDMKELVELKGPIHGIWNLFIRPQSLQVTPIWYYFCDVEKEWYWTPYKPDIEEVKERNLEKKWMKIPELVVQFGSYRGLQPAYVNIELIKMLHKLKPIPKRIKSID